MNIVDIVIIAILGLSVLIGLYRGFISSVASMGGCLLSLGCCSNWTIPDKAGHIFQSLLLPCFKPLLKGGKEFVF